MTYVRHVRPQVMLRVIASRTCENAYRPMQPNSVLRRRVHAHAQSRAVKRAVAGPLNSTAVADPIHARRRSHVECQMHVLWQVACCVDWLQALAFDDLWLMLRQSDRHRTSEGCLAWAHSLLEDFLRKMRQSGVDDAGVCAQQISISR